MARFFLALLACLLLAAPADAVAISAVLASSVAPPFDLTRFGNAGIDGLVSTAPIALTNGTISFAAGGAGLYDGNVPNVAASPASTGNYLVAEPGSAVTIAFDTPQTQFQLLWGSVDGYNGLTFTTTTGGTVTITGDDIRAIDGSSQSAYVTIAGLGPFTKVTATSSSPAFEFLPNLPVPEPGTLLLIGAALGGLAWARRRT